MSDQSPAERAASSIGRTPAEVAALDRIFAGLTDLAVARLRLDIAASECAANFRGLGAALQAADARASFEEALEVAAHPDLAELNVYLDGYYATPPPNLSTTEGES